MDIRIVDPNVSSGAITAANVVLGQTGKRNALVVCLANISGDVYNALGSAAGGDGAILDGVSSAIKATVRSATNSNPLHVIITNASGDMPNLAPPGGADGSIVDGVSSSIKATVKSYANSSPLVVALANASGDVYNGNSSTVTVTKWNLVPTQDAIHINSGLLGVTGDVLAGVTPGRQIGVVGSPIGVQVVGTQVGQFGISGDVLLRANPSVVIGQLGATVGVNVIGGSVGGRVSISGDQITIGGATAPIGISGDVSTLPKAGQTWPVSIAGTVSVTGSSSANPVGISGDQANPINVKIAVSTAGLGITGDVSTLPKAGQTWPVSFSGTVGVNVVGGSGGGTVGVSGDVSTFQKGAWATSVTGDVAVRQDATNTAKGTLSTPIGVNIIGGSVGGRFSSSGDTILVSEQKTIGVQIVGSSGAGTVGVSGDVSTFQKGAWATSITGDVAIRQDATNTAKGTLSTPIGVNIIGGSVGGKFSSSGDTVLVSEQKTIGVQIVGSSGAGTVGVSGDVSTFQRGAWAISITGDVMLRQDATNTAKGTLSTPIGVNIIGGSVGGRFSSSGDTVLVGEQKVTGVYITGGSGQGTAGVTGDVAIKPSNTTGIGRFPVSGDTGISDGVTRTTLATVKAYTDSNPLAVVLMNPSGDAYMPTPKEPLSVTLTGRITTAGNTTIAGGYNGRVIKVSRYEMQSQVNDSMVQLRSAASGDALTPQWIFGVREGVSTAVPQIGGGYLFKTNLAQALVIDHWDTNAVTYSVTFHTGDAF